MTHKNPAFYRLLYRLSSRIDQGTEFIGKSIAWLSLLMMLVMVAIVILRYGFSIGSIALQDSVTYLHCTVFMLGAAYTLKHDRHVRVDVFYRKRSPKQQAMIDLLGTTLLLIPVCLVIGFMSFDYVVFSWSYRETSPEAGGLPWVYLLKTLILVMVALLIVQGISEFLKNLLFVLDQAPAPEHEKEETL